MIVTAMLAWWDEPPDMLATCVESLPVLCDRLVAVDGGYELTPGATAQSPPEQAKAIRAAAKKAGIPLDLYVPETLWEGQVQKRDFLMQQATKEADWVMPVDADYVLHGPRDAIRSELGRVEADSVQVEFYTSVPEGLDVKRVAPHAWHSEIAGYSLMTNLLFRALPEMRVEFRHWWYSGLKDGKRVALWGCDEVYPRAATWTLQAPLLVEHRCFFRDRMRLDRNKAFCARRDQQVTREGVEA